MTRKRRRYVPLSEKQQRQERLETVSIVAFLVVAALFLGAVVFLTAVRLESMGCSLTYCPIEALRG